MGGRVGEDGGHGRGVSIRYSKDDMGCNSIRLCDSKVVLEA